MLVVETIARIRRDHLVKGVPIKKLARDLRVSRNTIRKVVRGDATSHTYEHTLQPMPKLGPWVEELERRLEANERTPRRDRLSLLRIHEDLAAQGYEGGYDAVRRYAKAWRRRRRLLSPSQAYVPLSFDPGEAYQFDWSHEYARLAGATTRVKAAHMRLCYSRSRAHARARSRCSWFGSSRAKARRWSSSCAPRAWSRDVLNILARQRQPAPPATVPTPEGLQLRHQPVADCQRYDSPREAGTLGLRAHERATERHDVLEMSRVHARGIHDDTEARGHARRLRRHPRRRAQAPSPGAFA